MAFQINGYYMHYGGFFCFLDWSTSQKESQNLHCRAPTSWFSTTAPGCRSWTRRMFIHRIGRVRAWSLLAATRCSFVFISPWVLCELEEIRDEGNTVGAGVYSCSCCFIRVGNYTFGHGKRDQGFSLFWSVHTPIFFYCTVVPFSLISIILFDLMSLIDVSSPCIYFIYSTTYHP
ncbi:uncharacterized protein EI97DRAFT_190452 [Westerdykella ornata]|uniref:Uncharacterized protein n=1 Tax=Westerdykella ornata TaxID=318751 RepID=A0A6A6JA64_WESOR|nr:uncharacterized protein EI97DRAFT_190452 [Westerdykella ornata]KAF2273124.1 hypothetical protein EI97DRAFT_190452 [Westerdykella ornata]